MSTLAVLGGALAVATGCSDNTVSPELLQGAGIRLTLPAGTDQLPWVRVELWDDNVTPPPDCAAGQAAGAATATAPEGFRLLAAGPSIPDPISCDRKEVIIWDLTGEVVLHLADVPFGGRLPLSWDGLDDAGNPVPSGYYSTYSHCLDGVEFSFTGAYFMWRDSERGSCRWPLWMRTVDPAPAGRTVTFGPFPESVNTTLFDDEGKPKELVVFKSPFTVRVVAPGMEPFEQEITLTKGRFADVAVTFTAAAAAPGTGRNGTIR